MKIVSSQATPIYPGYISKLSTAPRPFGRKVFGGLNGLSGCGCGPVDGCNCTPTLSGMGATSSLDQIISNAFSWLSGTVQASLPASASVPPQYGSTGAVSSQIQEWLPWLIGGFLVYKIISK